MTRIAIVILIVLCTSGCASAPRTDAVVQTADLRLRMERADRALREARLIDAEVLYRDLARTNPNLPDLWLRLGNIYVRQGQLEAADRAYRDGMRLSPQDGRLWFNLALVQLRQAAETLEISSEVLPVDSPYREPIGSLHRALLDVSASPGGSVTTEVSAP